MGTFDTWFLKIIYLFNNGLQGTLVKALRNGDWVLLDEINLAAAETLECLSGLLESQAGSLMLTERGLVCIIRILVD